MAINKKLIHFKTRAAFEAQLAGKNILDTSIVFIKDANLIWTHGAYYGSTEALNTKINEINSKLGTINSSITNLQNNISSLSTRVTNVENSLKGVTNSVSNLEIAAK